MFRVIPYFLVWVFVLLYVAELRAEGPVVDPALTPSKTLVCDMPVTRADGSPLAVGDIASINFLRSGDGATWAPDGSTNECRLVLDLSAMPEGQYYYTATATDTEGRESGRSNVVPFALARIPPPSPPANLGLVD